MKKLSLILALVLAAPVATGQTVGASQIKKKTNGGLAADSANALTVSITRSNSAPASPVTGQLWLDTTGTPAILKSYNGATWEDTQTNSTMPVQADTTSFPANPVDGQLVWDRTQKLAYVYDNTDATWRRLTDGKTTSGSYVLPTSATVITPPSVAPGLTFSAGGSATAGEHECVYTFANSTGGETTPSPASTPATAGASATYSLTNVAVGGTGTTARRVYCSKAGVPGVWYWVAEIADNTTTTVTATTADASNVQPSPSFNYSGALHSGWSCQNCSNDSGGCGTASDGDIGCKVFRAGTNAVGITADTMPRAAMSLASWGAGVAIEARIVGTGFTVAAPGNWLYGLTFGLRASTNNNDPVLQMTNYNRAAVSLSYPAFISQRVRLTSGAAGGTPAYYGIFPAVWQYPYFVRAVRETVFGAQRWLLFASADGLSGWTLGQGSGSYVNEGVYYQIDFNQIEVGAGHYGTGASQAETRVDSIRVWTTGL